MSEIFAVYIFNKKKIQLFQIQTILHNFFDKYYLSYPFWKLQ